MKKKFDTLEEATEELEARRKAAYKKIDEDNDEIFDDSSYVSKDFIDKKKYVVNLLIITKKELREGLNRK